MLFFYVLGVHFGPKRVGGGVAIYFRRRSIWIVRTSPCHKALCECRQRPLVRGGWSALIDLCRRSFALNQVKVLWQRFCISRVLHFNVLLLYFVQPSPVPSLCQECLNGWNGHWSYKHTHTLMDSGVTLGWVQLHCVPSLVYNAVYHAVIIWLKVFLWIALCLYLLCQDEYHPRRVHGFVLESDVMQHSQNRRSWINGNNSGKNTFIKVVIKVYKHPNQWLSQINR